MYQITEQNERRSRNHALWLAIALHLALGAVLYLNMSETPATKKTEISNVVKSRPMPQPKTVSLP